MSDTTSPPAPPPAKKKPAKPRAKKADGDAPATKAGKKRTAADKEADAEEAGLDCCYHFTENHSVSRGKCESHDGAASLIGIQPPYTGLHPLPHIATRSRSPLIRVYNGPYTHCNLLWKCYTLTPDDRA